MGAMPIGPMPFGGPTPPGLNLDSDSDQSNGSAYYRLTIVEQQHFDKEKKRARRAARKAWEGQQQQWWMWLQQQ
jgi:hypothetical protein